MRVILLRGLLVALFVGIGWALACKAGDVLTIEPSPEPGDLGSRESPVPFGVEIEWRSLRIRVDRWELIDCLLSELATPALSAEDCPEDPFSGDMVRFFVSVTSVSADEPAPGVIRFFLVLDDQGYPNLLPRIEDRFPRDVGALEPRQTIEGWVYSVRPQLPVWEEPGRVLLQAVVGGTPLSEGGLFWQIPPPTSSDGATEGAP